MVTTPHAGKHGARKRQGSPCTTHHVVDVVIAPVVVAAHPLTIVVLHRDLHADGVAGWWGKEENMRL